MQITAKLHGTLRKYLPKGTHDNSIVVDVPDGGTVADVIDRLDIPRAHTRMLVSGNEQLEQTSVLYDGQEVNIFPPLAGGA